MRLWDVWHRVQVEAEVRDWDLRWSIAERADALGVPRPLDPDVTRNSAKLACWTTKWR